MSTPEFYDKAMCSLGSLALLPIDNSPWLPMYAEAARFIPSGHDVVDLGCGTGRFAYYLMNETSYYGNYTGVDFSQDALSEASKYSAQEDFRCIDLNDWQPDAERLGATTYVSLEVLEHLEDDLGLVAKIPPGHQFVFSVPNYESEAHVRWFRNARDIFDRYASFLTFRHWSLVELDDRKAIHVWDSYRRKDSW